MGRHDVRRWIAGFVCGGATLFAAPAIAGASVSGVELEDEVPITVPVIQPVADATTFEPEPDPATPTSGVSEPLPAQPDGDVEEPVAAPTEPAAEPEAPSKVTEEPASRPPRVVPTIESHCWMGLDRPVYVLRNQDPVRSLRYSWSAPGAGRRGWLEPRWSGDDAAWFVGTGSFPHAAPVQVEYVLGGEPGSLVAPAADPAFCTYRVRPIVRWIDTTGADVMPTAEQVAGWTLRIDGPLDALDCVWNGAGLACSNVPNPEAPLPEGSYHMLGRDTEIHVPAFDDTALTIVASPDPQGFRLAGGTGRLVLPDVGDGLGQSNVDDRAAAFFPPRLQTGGALQLVSVIFEMTEPPPQVLGTTVARPGGAATVAPVPATKPGVPAVAPPRPQAAPARSFRLPETGGAPIGLLVLGVMLVLAGSVVVVVMRLPLGRQR
jgi:hypothetical protein